MRSDGPVYPSNGKRPELRVASVRSEGCNRCARSDMIPENGRAKP